MYYNSTFERKFPIKNNKKIKNIGISIKPQIAKILAVRVFKNFCQISDIFISFSIPILDTFYNIF